MPKELKIASILVMSEERIDEVDVMHTDKHESLLQVDTIVLIWLTRHVQNTQANWQCICDISRKKLGMKLRT